MIGNFMHKKINYTRPKAKVAIIVTCYNIGQYLSECLESIIQQTFTDWVCVVVDDGSRDNTAQIAKQYCQRDPRFHYFWQRNSGVACARNNGIAFSQSEYILPLDADDYLGTTFLEKTVKIAEENPAVKIVYSNTQLFGLVNKPFELPEYSFSRLLRYNMIVVTALYRRHDFENTSGYDSKLRGLEDWDFWLSLLGHDSQVIRIDEALFYYRQSKGSKTGKTSSKKRNEIVNYIYNKHFDKYSFYQDDPDVLNYRIKILEKEIEKYHRSRLFGLWSFITKINDLITLLLSSSKKLVRELFSGNKKT